MELLRELFDSGGLDFGQDVDDDENMLVYESHEARRKLFDEIASHAGMTWEEGSYYFVAKNVDQEDLFLRLQELKNELVDGPLDKGFLEDNYDPEENSVAIRDYVMLKWLWDCEDGFSDTWDRCSDCGKLVYTSATSYCDSGRYIVDEGEITCRSCVKKSPGAHLDRYLECVDTPEPIQFILDPGDVGFEPLTEDSPLYGETTIKFHNGLHHGMADDPRAARRLLNKAYISEVIFDVEPSQFYVEWSVWTRPHFVAPATALLSDRAKLFVSISEALVVKDDNGLHECWLLERDVLSDEDPEVPHARWEDSDEDRWYAHPEPTRTKEEHEALFNDPTRVRLCLDRLDREDLADQVWYQEIEKLTEYPTPAQRCEVALRGVSVELKQSE